MTFPEGSAGDWRDVSRPLSAAASMSPGDRGLTVDTVVEGDVRVSAISTTCHVGSDLDGPPWAVLCPLAT